MPHHLVPVRDGGRLSCFEKLMNLLRALAARDPVPAVGYGSTLPAALPVWAWGEAEQREVVARHIREGRSGACAVGEWLGNRALLGSFFEEGRWLIMCWDRLPAMAGLRAPAAADDHDAERLLGAVAQAVHEGRRPSLTGLAHG
ncbi:hypothetical protein [Sinosporangium siamense]|uniref:Uncharacterized protein n=1 Tax=Sinosporangium siamense TaxID=1367973 RepID=A0A919RPR6_9ACTN|nr:hypothetical protein [Sinosporangium siamense]GII96770.1 hypothetical protein Ssi02_70010 [Sinosporangium siamense]